jgi:peptide/nickel transport system substrate-binding protein
MPEGTAQESVPITEDIQRDLGVSKHRRNVIAKCLSIALLAILISSALMVTPTVSDRAAALAAPIVMTVGLTEAADTFNPFSMMSGTSWIVAWDMYEVLVTRDPTTLKPMPMLGQSWDTSSDGKVWTFHLVENSVWHDGIPVTAEDVNWTFNLIISHPNECGLYQGYVRNITEVFALDDYTVRFTTDVPKATMLTMNVPILPKHLWSSVPLNKLGQVDLWDGKYFPNGPVGSGPMILSSYSRTLGDIWMLKWDRYHMDVINVDKVLYKVFTSEDAMMNSLFSGSIDVAIGIPISLWNTTIDTPGIEGQVADQLDLHHIGFNCAPQSVRDGFSKASTNTETCNTSVRRAVAMAVNKTQIVTEILRGLADKGDTLIPPITPFWKYNVSEEEELKFDPEKAKALLDAAGYRDIDDDGIRENVTSGVELSFGFYYPTGYDADELACQKISKWLTDIGINAPARGISETSLFQYQYNMQYDIFSWSWWPEYDPSWILSVVTTGQIPDDPGDWAAWSDTFYSNPAYDQLWNQQQTAVNLTDRQTIVHEMQRILYHDCPYIILWYPYGLYAYRTDRFENFPDFEAQPGARPGDIFFFFQVTPTGVPPVNEPPIANAGLDVVAYQGETVSFTGDATDPNDAVSTLAWSWAFEEPDHTVQTLSGRTVSYTFNNLGTVNATLTVTDPGGLSDTDSLVVTVEPVPANVGWLVGYVDSAGAPVVGAVITAGNMSRSTDASGFFNLTLVAGTHTVNVSATGYASAMGSATITAQEETWLNFTLAMITLTLKGHVYDADTHDSIAGATVNLLSANVSVSSVRTNATGYYEILHIPFGTYTVRASMTDYETNESTLTVSTPGMLVRDFELTPSAHGGGEGLSTMAIVGIAAVVIIIAGVAVVFVLTKRRKSAQPPPAP